MNHDLLNPSVNKLIKKKIGLSLIKENSIASTKDKIKTLLPYMTVERRSNVFYLLDYQLLNTKHSY